MNSTKNKYLAGPYLIWMTGFIIIPLLMIFYYGLTSRDGAFTFENIASIGTPEHLKALVLSLVLAGISTAVCLLIAYPLALILRNRHIGRGSFVVFIFILPMWMNFLLRTLAWQTLLEKNGVINALLSALHLPALAIINKLEAYDGCVAVCFLDGEFTLKRLRMGQGKIVLVPANKRYKPIEIGQESDFTVWGVVTYAIKKV